MPDQPKTTIDAAVLKEWEEKLPGCARFLNNFFTTCGGYSPEENYLNYRRDILLYYPSSRDIRRNELAATAMFFEEG